MKMHINQVVLISMLGLLSGCSTVELDRTLHPIDCTSGAKSEECSAVADLDKKTQKKTVTQSEQRAERRTRSARLAEIRRNNDKVKLKNEAKNEIAPPTEENTIESKQDLITQKKANADKHAKDFAESMDCVKNNVRKKDNGRTNIRSVAYELAMMCTKEGIHVNTIANAAIPQVQQNRAHK